MTSRVLTFVLLLSTAIIGCKGLGSSYPAQPGTLFVRQSICDLDYFKKTFLGEGSRLKGQGFTSYGLYRDIHDPKTYLLVFECRDLQKGVDYLQSSHYKIACGGPWNGILWAGLGTTEDEQGVKGDGAGADLGLDGSRPSPRHTQGAPLGMRASGQGEGLAVILYVGGGEGSWKADLETGPSRIYPLAEGPPGVIAARESPDVFKAWDDYMKLKALPAGTRRDAWFGIRLQRGDF